MSPCTLIGILDDGWAGLSGLARERIAGAACVIGTARCLEMAEPHLSPGTHRLCMDGAVGQLPDWVRKAQAERRAVVVLATGDPLCHGLGTRLIGALGAESVEVLPAQSNLQIAFARLKRPWQSARIVSCHGTDAGEWMPGATPDHGLYPVLRAVARHPLVAVFTGPENGPDRIARALLAAGFEDAIRLSVAACLCRPDESLYPDLLLADAAGRRFPEPNVLIVEHRLGSDGKEAAAPLLGLPDRCFARQRGGEDVGLISKLEVRALALGRLALRPDSLVWDIGAGSGSVGLEASRIAADGHVWAIERDPARAADARANARRLRATNYSLFEGRAPDGLAGWPDPDAVFIGGSDGALEALIELAAARLRPGGRLVLTLIVVERLGSAIAALERAGLAWELTQLFAARSRPIGGLHRLAALNPVWMLAASREIGHG
jgi:precorrin-6Y C5,15-methyltransferase (decarboxylating)